jgi:hypothetical protein
MNANSIVTAVLVVTGIFSASIGRASDLPATAALIYQVEGSGCSSNSRDTQSQCLIFATEAARAKVIQQEKESLVDLRCAGVYRRWTSAASIFYTFVNVSAYCTPRPFSEQLLVSFQHACFIKPEEACMKQSVLDSLNAIKPTVYVDLNKI